MAAQKARPTLLVEGFRLRGTEYEPLVPQRGRFTSAVLGLDLMVERERLRFFTADAELPGAEDLIEKLEGFVDDLEARLASAERRADYEARRAENEARRAEDEARRAEDEARRAEDEARRADEMRARLEAALAELERLKKR